MAAADQTLEDHKNLATQQPSIHGPRTMANDSDEHGPLARAQHPGHAAAHGSSARPPQDDDPRRRPLCLDGMVAPMVLDGPINSDWFEAYVAQVLLPTLGPETW